MPPDARLLESPALIATTAPVRPPPPPIDSTATPVESAPDVVSVPPSFDVALPPSAPEPPELPK